MLFILYVHNTYWLPNCNVQATSTMVVLAACRTSRITGISRTICMSTSSAYFIRVYAQLLQIAPVMFDIVDASSCFDIIEIDILVCKHHCCEASCRLFGPV